jgi:glucose-6-phosphate 1-dehydrogenase
VERLTTNRLVLHLQPEEGISLRFGAKMPGPVMNLGAVDMDFDYTDYFGSTPSTGYERLIYDCMCGDATLFQRADMVEAGWSKWSRRFRTCGALCRRVLSRTTPQARGGPKKLINCWSATGVSGGGSNDSRG